MITMTVSPSFTLTHCNPETDISIPGSGIEKFVIPKIPFWD